MNKIINNFLLAGDKAMSEMQLRQSAGLSKPGSSYNACRLFTKNKETIQKFKETGDSSYIYQNEPDKVCFQHDMAYGNFKHFPIRAAADKVLDDKEFNIVKNPKYHGYQRGLASLVYKFFNKKLLVAC